MVKDVLIALTVTMIGALIGGIVGSNNANYFMPGVPFNGLECGFYGVCIGSFARLVLGLAVVKAIAKRPQSPAHGEEQHSTANSTSRSLWAIALTVLGVIVLVLVFCVLALVVWTHFSPPVPIRWG
jgi:hypothetical protein